MPGDAGDHDILAWAWGMDHLIVSDVDSDMCDIILSEVEKVSWLSLGDWNISANLRLISGYSWKCHPKVGIDQFGQA